LGVFGSNIGFGHLGRDWLLVYVCSVMNSAGISKAKAATISDLFQVMQLLLSAVAMSCCVNCIGQGRDLVAAYWALVALIAPQLEIWFRERE
jgi:hypothetical protein